MIKLDFTNMMRPQTDNPNQGIRIALASKTAIRNVAEAAGQDTAEVIHKVSQTVTAFAAAVESIKTTEDYHMSVQCKIDKCCWNEEPDHISIRVEFRTATDEADTAFWNSVRDQIRTAAINEFDKTGLKLSPIGLNIADDITVLVYKDGTGIIIEAQVGMK